MLTITVQKVHPWGYEGAYMYAGTAIPTVGTFMLGDWVFNTAAGTSAVAAWVCTTAGTPGTWKAIVIS